MSAKINEDLRRAVLEVLAARHPTALPLAAMRRRIVLAGLVDGEFEDAALESALVFCEGQGWITVQIDPCGATKYWRATSSGVLAFERGG